jgi:hypothetical protein
MFTVYFENEHYSEQVAMFKDKETFLNCLPALELLAHESDMNVLCKEGE